MLRLFLFFLLPFLLLFLYVGMRVETSLLKREIRVATLERETLRRKNRSLRNRVAELEGNSMEKIYWDRYGALPIYVRNRVVNLRLPDAKGPGDQADRMTGAMGSSALASFFSPDSIR